ncbi:MAG: porin, partial [Phycisphaerales bacterium]
MNNSAQITAAALIVAAATGFSAAGSLELDRAYASELKADAGARSVLNQPAMGGIDVGFGVRFGYSWNERGGATNDMGDPEPDNETTNGFQFHDAEVAVEGDVTDNMHARISFDFGPDDSGSWLADHGSAELEDAFVDWTVNDGFILRVGQFVPAFSAEASTSEYHMTNPFRSVTRRDRHSHLRGR